MRGAAISLATLAVAVAAACLTAWGLGHIDDTSLPRAVALAVPVGAVWLTATHLAAGARSTGSLRAQYALAVAGTVVVACAVVLAMAALMFVSERDAALLAALMAFAAVVGARTATVLAARAADDVERVREGLDAIAAGDLGRRIEPGGASELQSLARSANHLAESLERASEERDAAERARRALVASVSHDLRTPLTSLRLLVDAIRDGVVAEPAEVRVALDRIGTNAEALSALVDDLFELARLEAGDVTWALSAVEVGELVSETVEALRPQAEHKGLRLAGGVEGAAPPISANPEKLQRVLANLIGNALRHTPPDGTVMVRAEPADRYVLFEVADDGEGMSADDAEHAFDRFWRSDAARQGGGAGLGLSICQAIVEAHGGRIWIEPGRARGTSVRFTVPAAGAGA